MVKEKPEVLPLYPWEYDCRAPTASRILDVFYSLQRHELVDGDAARRRFDPQHSPLRRDLPRLLGAPAPTYPGGP